jgi:hypothetical protein
MVRTLLSEKSVLVPEDGIVHTHCREDLKSYMSLALPKLAAIILIK